ncbi:MAG TPA: hypothetical protein VKA83_09385 [Methylomirabilota bacterium]|nr:hypothetical protein [Methylomirabilota bacterium]
MTHPAIKFDGSGWTTGWVLREGPTVPVGVPDEHPVDLKTWDDVRLGRTYAVQEGMLRVPHDDRAVWKRARQLGESGDDAARRCRLIDAVRAEYPDAGVPANATPYGGLPLPSMTYPGVPGLELLPFDGDDLDVLVPVMMASGLVAATCPPTCGVCRPPEAHGWLQAARRLGNGNAWQTRLAFNGVPLQHEIIVREDGGIATFSLTVHHSRERPSWFWREAERPVFEHLLNANVRHLQSDTRADRPDWIASLTANYGARVIGTARPDLEGQPMVTRLDFPLDLGVFQGWPLRKRLGFDQSTGAVRTWEATEADLPAVEQLIRETVPPDLGQRATALRMVQEWWHLDRATLLLGAQDGTLRYARMLRHRRPGVASLATVGGLFDEPGMLQSSRHVGAWAFRAGYTTLSSFVKQQLVDHPKMQAAFARGDARVVRTRADWKEPFVEVEIPVKSRG